MNYVVCRFATSDPDGWQAPDTLDVEGVDLKPLNFASHLEFFRHKAKRLKTQTNWEFELREVWVPSAIFKRAQDEFSVIEQASDAYFFPQFRGLKRERTGYLPRFVCAVSGRVRLCECARVWVEMRLRDLKDTMTPGSASPPALEFAELVAAEFMPHLCHLCVLREHGRELMLDRYGSEILTDHRLYVDQWALVNGSSVPTATTEIQSVLGVARWKRETELYVVVRDLFPEHAVEREARLPWLGGLRLDVFVPELQLAFEHMGEQHYRPITIFGGEVAHRRTVERDILKRDLCQKHGVTVIDVKPDEAITAASLRRRVPASMRGKAT